MDTIIQDLLSREGALAGCGGVAPIYAVVAGGLGAGSWVSLLTALATSDRKNFYFGFDRRLRPGMQTLLRYRDEKLGMISVDCIVGSVVEHVGWFEVHVIKQDDDNGAALLLAA